MKQDHGDEILEGSCLADLNHPEAERQDGKPGHFEVLHREWQADDRDGEKSGHEQVHQRKLKTRKKYPDDIHDD